MTITETIVLKVRPGVRLDGREGEEVMEGKEGKTFRGLLDVVGGREGFVRMFWGHKIEDPLVFVWLIDWEKLENHTLFMESNEYPAFLEGVAGVFEMEESPVIIHTQYTNDYAPSVLAPVTEIAFCSLPDTAGEEERQKMDSGTKGIGEDVQSVGGATGSSTSWVLPQIPKLPSPTQLGASLALVALFGYDSIETHMKWRETPEHAKAIEVMGRMSKEIGLKDFEVGGGGMWHVDFHSYP